MEASLADRGMAMSGVIKAGHEGGRVRETVPRHRLGDAGRDGRAPVAAIDACPTCGKPVKSGTYALTCRSCGEVLVRDAGSDPAGRARPDGVLPFAVDEKAARAAFSAWVSSRRFAPRSLKDVRNPHSLTAVFLPFWVFDTTTDSLYRGQRGETKHRNVMRTRTNADGNSETYWERERYTDWDDVVGRVSLRFDNLVVPACSPLAAEVPGWPLDQVGPYPPGGPEAPGPFGPPGSPNSPGGPHIVGYDIDPEQAFESTRAGFAKEIERAAAADIGGDQQRVRGVETRYVHAAYALILLPAWLVTYRQGPKTWSALVNGVDGEVAGKRPYSATKFSVLAALAAVAVVAAVLLAGRHGG